MAEKDEFPLEKTTGRVQDPNPDRFRYLADVFYRFAANKISIADIAGMSRRHLQRLAEIGFLKYQYGRLEEAKDVFRALSKVDHKNYYYRAALGGIYQKLKKWVDAVANYTIALTLNSKDIASLVNRGEIYLRHEKFKKAAEDFRAAILCDPHGKNLWANRARSLVIALKRNLQAKKEGGKKRGPTVYQPKAATPARAATAATTPPGPTRRATKRT